jgi:hypothetical protein
LFSTSILEVEEVKASSLDFWTKRLRPIIENPTSLPLRFQSNLADSSSGRSQTILHHIEFKNPKFASTLDAFVRKHKLSVFHVTMALAALLLNYLEQAEGMLKENYIKFLFYFSSDGLP